MLLEMKQPACSRDFYVVANFIIRVLNYAEKHAGRPFDEALFRQYFGGEAQWYLRYTGIVRKGLESLFQLNSDEIGLIRDTFKHDYAFHKKRWDINYRFKSVSLPQPLFNVLRDFIEPFFTSIFCDGSFRNLKGQQTARLDRKTYLDQYRSINHHNSHVCPTCLGSIGILSGLLLAENEHYFPKSKYAALAFSPNNLIPICSECNSPQVHGSTDPIEDHNMANITNIYLPYYQTALGHIKLNFEFGMGLFHVTITPILEGDVINIERIKRMNILYKLEDRWSERITLRFGLIKTSIMKYTKGDLTKENIEKALCYREDVCKPHITDNSDAFLEMEFVKWLRTVYINKLLLSFN
ncbi:hypothetical protein DVH26_00260 [Paenibacillus sp. H1-7]|uniref:hypothetical protein n=1 Tax=Paenibacillus sp. H1-7 TaxID=2282849 RepID=UPI001EF83612|nr:hypothetical protein [Paenibacillus sp. H1-7]ULL13050.1 hypothetical protein DVH26_00260 [Paenibacillus sp. H1-7]